MFFKCFLIKHTVFHQISFTLKCHCLFRKKLVCKVLVSSQVYKLSNSLCKRNYANPLPAVKICLQSEYRPWIYVNHANLAHFAFYVNGVSHLRPPPSPDDCRAPPPSPTSSAGSDTPPAPSLPPPPLFPSPSSSRPLPSSPPHLPLSPALISPILTPLPLLHTFLPLPPTPSSPLRPWFPPFLLAPENGAHPLLLLLPHLPPSPPLRAPTLLLPGKMIGAPRMMTSFSVSNAMNDFDPVGAMLLATS